MLRMLRAIYSPVPWAAQADRFIRPRAHQLWGHVGALAVTLVAALPQAAYAGAYTSANARAVQWLETQQDTSDGSWHDNSEARTFLQTTEAVLALHQANRRRSAYYAGQTWLENHDPPNLDARARRLLVLRATQSSAQPDVDALLAAVSTPTAGQSGWGLAKRYRASPLDTALVLDALRTAGASFNSAQTIAYLKATQLIGTANQGWSAVLGGATDAYTTARVVQALSAFRDGDPTLAVPLANAVTTLKAIVGTSSAPHVRAATALAYLRMEPASNEARTLLDSLLGLQNVDGGFDAGVFATGLILQAFAAAEGTDTSASREQVNVPDAALRKAINDALGRGAMDQLSRGELAQLTTLDASNLGITDLAGLQSATNLLYLNLRGNPLNIPANVDSDSDGVTDIDEIAVATNPFNASSTPWLRNQGGLFDHASIILDTPTISMQEPAWHAVADDFDHDGDLDLLLFFQSGNEKLCDLGGNPCEFGGPNFGNLVYMENDAGNYVRRAFSNEEDFVNGDIEQMVPLDYNNDGKTDLLLVTTEFSSYDCYPTQYCNKPRRRLVLFKNDSGSAYASTGNPSGTHLSDATSAAGLDSAAWYAEGLVLDLNRDGYPDILGIKVDASYAVVGDAYIFNPGNGTYTATAVTGLPRPLWFSGLIDLDGDGRLDIAAHDITAGMRFFRNDGNASFTELINAQSLAGLAGKWFVKFVPADMDGDGRTDLVIFETDITGEEPWQTYNGTKIRLLRNLGVSGSQITMMEQSATAFESNNIANGATFGGTVGDINNDGFPDILAVARPDASRLVVADGLGGYVNPEGIGEVVGLDASSRWADPVLVDFNLDGKADLLSTQSIDAIAGGNYLLQNTGKAVGSRNGISIELTGRNRTEAPSSGKDAFGARVEVIASGHTYTRSVMPVMGLSRRMHFGLGDSVTGIQIKVYWPGNPTPQVLNGDAYVNSILRVTEP